METKTYTYQEPFFTMEVKVEGGFCAFLTVLLAWNAYTNLFGMGILFAIFAIVAFYQTWNTFIARCYSHSVTIGDDEISFSSSGARRPTRSAQIRGGSRGGKMYVRVGKHNALHGRFWISTDVYEDGEELASRLIEIENAVDPDSLRVQARRTNTEYKQIKGGKKKKSRK